MSKHITDADFATITDAELEAVAGGHRNCHPGGQVVIAGAPQAPAQSGYGLSTIPGAPTPVYGGTQVVQQKSSGGFFGFGFNGGGIQFRW